MEKSVNFFVAAALFICLGIATLVLLRLNEADKPEQNARVETSPATISAPPPAANVTVAQDVAVRVPDNELPGLLSSGRFEEAIESYDRSLGGLDDRDAERGRASILAFASELIERERVVQAEELLRLYTDLFFQDIQALLLLSDSLAAQGLLSESLDFLLQARNLAYTDEQIIGLDRRLIIAARAYADELKSYDDRYGIVAVYQMLYNQYPDNGEFSYELAKAQAEAGRPHDAYALLQQLRLNPGYQQRAEDYMKALRPELEQFWSNSKEEKVPLEIPLVPHGGHYSISANVDGEDVSLLLDTGASITTLTPRVIRRISARRSNRTITLQTANGSVQSGIYTVRRFSLGSVQLHNFELASVSLDGMEGIDGLLGTDFLELFNYTINNQTDMLVLAPVRIEDESNDGPG